jgi:hypothetical protein
MVSPSDKDVTKRCMSNLNSNEKTLSVASQLTKAPSPFFFAHSAYLYLSSGTACSLLEFGQKVSSYIITSIVVAPAVSQTAPNFCVPA